jgi:hypothetical protein
MPRSFRRPVLAATVVLFFLLLLSSSSSSRAQEAGYAAEDGGADRREGDSYRDYADPYGQPDSLYADYAAHQQDKVAGAGGYVRLGGCVAERRERRNEDEE